MTTEEFSGREALPAKLENLRREYVDARVAILDLILEEKKISWQDIAATWRHIDAGFPKEPQAASERDQLKAKKEAVEEKQKAADKYFKLIQSEILEETRSLDRERGGNLLVEAEDAAKEAWARKHGDDSEAIELIAFDSPEAIKANEESFNRVASESKLNLIADPELAVSAMERLAEVSGWAQESRGRYTGHSLGFVLDQLEHGRNNKIYSIFGVGGLSRWMIGTDGKIVFAARPEVPAVVRRRVQEAGVPVIDLK